MHIHVTTYLYACMHFFCCIHNKSMCHGHSDLLRYFSQDLQISVHIYTYTHAYTHAHTHCRYIIGMSLTRLLVPLYALACPSNFFHWEPNYPLATALVCWMSLQVCVSRLPRPLAPIFRILQMHTHKNKFPLHIRTITIVLMAWTRLTCTYN